MVSVPVPRLFQYMERSHMIFMPGVVQRTITAARPLTPVHARVLKLLRDPAEDDLGDDHVARPVRGHVGELHRDVDALGFWTRVQVSRPSEVCPSARYQTRAVPQADGVVTDLPVIRPALPVHGPLGDYRQ